KEFRRIAICADGSRRLACSPRGAVRRQSASPMKHPKPKDQHAGRDPEMDVGKDRRNNGTWLRVFERTFHLRKKVSQIAGRTGMAAGFTGRRAEKHRHKTSQSRQLLPRARPNART